MKLRTSQQIEAAIKSAPLEDRQTLRTTAASSGVPKTTLVRHMKTIGNLRGRTSRVKPLLTLQNQAWRLRHALNLLQPQSHGGHVFTNMHDRVHIDEKWFYVTKVKRRFYAYADEKLPLRPLKSAKFIKKVMFLAAVARPRFDPHKKQFFDGKIGIWPFVSQVEAVRSSKNRPRGTLVTVPKNVDAAAYREMVLNNVIPAIQVKFPRSVACVNIQQDNASPHRCIDSAELCRNGITDINVSNQPANSPDFNVLDLGIFNSIQKAAFCELPMETIGKSFITLQKVMELSMSDNGGNNFKLPHMSKNSTKMNLASFNLQCNPSVFSQALNCLNSQN
ncbi:hypothetical protein Ae201684P_010209 [Aphanomyces euteiches]|nr:hypothetical protein Ae201684P_013485 [Aphanomyces euteiches]KAH9095034.1 hypothetical protein Ae201684P_017278 [Aphanomyces euteiches]KAH9096005.1 hypothetical protein Ae201684P_010209 [Aphanomyces euteiches]